MKKTLITLSSLLLSMNFNTAIADGCSSLANTTWTGQAKFISNKIIPIKAVITSVTAQGGLFFNLKGTINGEEINGMFGCTEYQPGVIQGVDFTSDNISIMSIAFYPNARSPVGMLRIGGKLHDDYVDTTSEPTKNFLSRN